MESRGYGYSGVTPDHDRCLFTLIVARIMRAASSLEGSHRRTSIVQCYLAR